MKTMFLRRIMAVLMAVMLLVPMAAQADSAAEYGEINLSNVVVNYMGTEFDFTGLDLKLLGGADAENKNAIAGLALGVSGTSNANFAAELGENEMTVLLANQLISIPYDRFGECMAKLGAEDAEMMPDISEAMQEFWKALAEGGNSLEDYFESFDAKELESLNKVMTEKLNVLLEDAVPEEAKFTVDGNEYEGQKVAIALNAEKATELLSTAIKELYGSDAVKKMMAPMFDFMNQMMEASGETGIDMTGMYDSMVDNLSKITLPKGLTITTYVAGEGADMVMRIDAGRFTMDMTDYLTDMMSTMGEDAELTEEELAAAVMDMEYSIELAGLSEDGLNEAEYMHLTGNMYMADAEEAFINLNMELTDKDGKGALTYDIVILPDGMGETGAPMNMALNAEWAESDGSDGFKASMKVDENDGESVVMDISWNQTDNDGNVEGIAKLNVVAPDVNSGITVEYMHKEADGVADGSFNLSVSDGDQTMDALDATYHCISGEHADDSETSHIDFDVSVMGMVTVTGKLNVSSMPMDADKLMTTGKPSVLNLADATDEELEALMTNVQSALMPVMLQAMQIPGVANIMAITSGDVNTNQTSTAIAG